MKKDKQNKKTNDSLGNWTDQSTTIRRYRFFAYLISKVQRVFFFFNTINKMGKTMHLCISWRQWQLLCLLKDIFEVFHKIFNSFTFWLQNTISGGTHLQGYSVQHIYTRMVITALFIIAKDWSHPTCPSIGNLKYLIKAMKYFTVF